MIDSHRASRFRFFARALIGCAPLFLLAVLLVVPSCTERRTRVAAPLAGVESAWEEGGRLELDDIPPLEYPDLHNVYRLSDRVISGGEPLSAEAFERLREMGVRTILSVDGKAPDAEAARRLGMRYVHVPIRYSNITGGEIARIVKTFRELEGPFYVHCFHGKHRGPAAAALGRLALDGASRDQALAEMRQWCQTSRKYEGLYRAVATAEIPGESTTQALAWNFPARQKPAGFRGAMVEAGRIGDRLKLLDDAGWREDPEHPDLVPARVVSEIEQVLRDARSAPESRDDYSEPFGAWLDEALETASALRGTLEDATSPSPTENAVVYELYTHLDEVCNRCHAEFRN